MSTILDRVVLKMRLREEIGQREHGATLDRGDMNERQWLQELQDELMDGALYCEKLLQGLDK